MATLSAQAAIAIRVKDYVKGEWQPTGRQEGGDDSDVVYLQYENKRTKERVIVRRTETRAAQSEMLVE